MNGQHLFQTTNPEPIVRINPSVAEPDRQVIVVQPLLEEFGPTSVRRRYSRDIGIVCRFAG